jgi:hypothetical protein
MDFEMMKPEIMAPETEYSKLVAEYETAVDAYAAAKGTVAWCRWTV